MPQETNLNVSPYFDDFDPDKNFYRVLFKPGYPIQARELTSSQSILQNQIEQFGNHVFKEGSVVIPGQLNYNNQFYAVKIENEFAGIPVNFYLQELVGRTIKGDISKIRAKIIHVIDEGDVGNEHITLFVSYLGSGTSGESVFLDGETLTLDESLSKESVLIQSGEGFSNTISIDSTSVGSAVILSEGVYFIRGTFVNVSNQILILDPYSNVPSYQVGFTVVEELITADEDPSLNDNAQGFSNYSAPGADRLKITAVLSKQLLDSDNNENFINLLDIRGGIIISSKNRPQYSVIQEELARRTSEESGDYYITPFSLTPKESLNNNLGNGGIFKEGQTTYNGNVPSDSLGIYKFSPGKAYVKGREVEIPTTVFLDFPKPRTVRTQKSQRVIYSTGSTYTLNRVYGAPNLDLSSPFIVSLRDSRVGTSQTLGTGKEIGLARVYDFALESGSYNTVDLNVNQWDISLFDIQTYTEIELNEPITLNTPVHIKGKSSGATAHLRYDVSNSGILTAYNIIGKFSVGEKFIFNGTENDSRIAKVVTDYTNKDVKSISQTDTSSTIFSANVIPSIETFIGFANITGEDISSGISTISIPSSSDVIFTNIVKTGSLITYTKPSDSLPTYSVVESVSQKSLTISGITTVSNINEGSLPSSDISVNDFSILVSRFQQSFDNALFTILPKPFISSVELNNSTLTIKKEFPITITGNQSSTVTADTNETFLPFDEERYVLTRSDGSFEILTQDKFVFTNGFKELTIFGLGANDSNARLISTLSKEKVTHKIKNKNRVNSIVIDKSRNPQSGIGSTTVNDGLIYGNYPYGTRVQDEEICLLVPDITRVYSILESSGTSDPVLPSINFNSINSPTNKTNDLLVGEEFIGRNSGAVCVYVKKRNDLSIEFTYLTDKKLQEGEIVTFKDSGVTASIGTLILGDRNIITEFQFDYGQKDTIYDYAKLKRIPGSEEPSKRIRVIYESATYSPSDDGDITTVNSYNQFDYCTITFARENVNNGDIIDIRPKVSEYTVSEANSRSPLEFLGRSFNQVSNSAKNILASDESIILDYSYYLPRIDRVFLTSDGVFQLNQGEPSEIPQPPAAVDNALEIASISLPPFLCDATKVTIKLMNHKRYQMKDIGKLEDRIKSLEAITTLNILETNTENLKIKDVNGLDRFKSGFFVDDFTSTSSQNKSGIVKNSIDPVLGELRPAPFTTEIDLQIGSKSLVGIGTSVDPSKDPKYVTDLVGNNIRRTGQLVTLDYDDVVIAKNPFATRVENVTPFLVTRYNGTIELFPSSDTWTDQVRTDAKRVEIDNYTETEQQLIAQGWDPQTGYSPVTWGAWETTWTGESTTYQDYNRYHYGYYGYYGYPYYYGYWNYPYYHGYWGHSYWWRYGYPYYYYGYPWYYRYTTTTIATTTKTGIETREGTQFRLTEKVDTFSQGDSIIATDFISYMRSRNVEFTGKRFKPFTQIYAFFDGEDVNAYIIPKLIEISMISGTFEVGETIIGTMLNYSINENPVSGELEDQIIFRAASANHRYGPYNDPTDIFVTNPYNSESTTPLPSDYSSTTEILNVDTYSLSEQAQGDFYGFIEIGMILRGQSSGAEATVTNIRLVTDNVGTVIGSFYIPNPNVPSNPTFETGTKTFRLTSSPVNSLIDGIATTSGEENYYAQGLLQTLQETIVSVRNARIESEQLSESRDISETTKSVSTSVRDIWGNTIHTYDHGEFGYCYWDPLAQSFFVREKGGVYITKVDLFFRTKDTLLPVVVQLRPMSNGVPKTDIYPFSEIIIEPKHINVSEDGSVATTVVFPSPIYLKGDSEHALVLLSESNEYTVWISRLGEVDATTQNLPESQQVVVTQQPLLGSLFKSQNGSTWDPSQYEDLKFVLYKAKFSTSPGDFNFYNPVLNVGNKQIANLLTDPLLFNSKKIKVSLSSTITDSNLQLGNTIIQSGSNASGNYVGIAGSAFGTLNILNSGIGYPDGYYTNVSLINETGLGKDATANITISSGSIVSLGATVSSGGSGYQVGDILTVSNLGGSTLGRNIQLSVSQINGNNELILDNVQGDFQTGVGKTVKYESSIVGVGSTDLNGTGSNVLIDSIVQYNEQSDGLHILVNHKNHGMHSGTNIVSIRNVYSDKKPSFLSVNYPNTSSGDITLTNMFIDSETGLSEFDIFENVIVSPSNPGYVIINNEIIAYTGVSGNNLTGVTRSIDQTKAFTYNSGTPVFKYENSGVSLRRINRIHSLQDAEVTRPRGLDYYYIKLDMSSLDKGSIIDNGSNGLVDRSIGSTYPKLYINQTKTTGGVNILATQNIQFEVVKPILQNVKIANTSMTARIRTISGTSIDGTETSYTDQGYETISLDSSTYLSSPRLVASKINEDNLLQNLPGKKSFTFNLQLNTSDENVSPAVDLDRVGMVLTSNRVNKAIDNYITDFRTSNIANDPSAFIYATDSITLNVPASSIKIYVSAHVNQFSDIRAFYAIMKDTKEESVFYPFPGYQNIIKTGQVIDISQSDGTPDFIVENTDGSGTMNGELDYRDYEFTIDNLPDFKHFSIKLIGTSTNQAYPPRFRGLRVIALA